MSAPNDRNGFDDKSGGFPPYYVDTDPGHLERGARRRAAITDADAPEVRDVARDHARMTSNDTRPAVSAGHDGPFAMAAPSRFELPFPP